MPKGKHSALQAELVIAVDKLLAVNKMLRTIDNGLPMQLTLGTIFGWLKFGR